jgi:hypothetical protein
MKLHGVALVQLSTNDLDRSALFYQQLMIDLFEGRLVASHADMRYWSAGPLALVLVRREKKSRGKRTVLDHAGLHLCFRVQSRRDVDCAHSQLQSLRVTIKAPPHEWPGSPGSYVLELAGPDRVRLMISYLPAKGYLGETLPIPVFRSAVTSDDQVAGRRRSATTVAPRSPRSGDRSQR